MQAAAATSRFLTGCSSKAGFPDAERVVSNPGVLHHIVAGHLIRTGHSQELFLKLTNEVIRFAEHAYLRRDLDALEEMSRILTNLPVDAARQIGLYYHALAIKRKGDMDEAQTLLETVADNAPLTYRARAIQSLGALYYDRGQFDETLRFQLEALRVASDKNAQGLQATMLAHWEISVIKNLCGDHKGAFSDLKSLNPLVSRVAKQKPFYFYAYCNALAVALGELGRVAEADSACKIALASPFAPAYPEWSETRDEIAAKRDHATPSVVSLNRLADAPPSPRAEAAPSPQIDSPRKLERAKAFGFSWPINNLSFQIPVTPIAAAAAITGVVQGILDWMLVGIRPRAPPALS
jgi:tetratricopeptide (TPR) repeat protein